jgi:hypothetical protein
LGLKTWINFDLSRQIKFDLDFIINKRKEKEKKLSKEIKNNLFLGIFILSIFLNSQDRYVLSGYLVILDIKFRAVMLFGLTLNNFMSCLFLKLCNFICSH